MISEFNNKKGGVFFQERVFTLAVEVDNLVIRTEAGKKSFFFD